MMDRNDMPRRRSRATSTTPTSCCRSIRRAFDWIDIRPSPLNYLAHGAMGLASSHALGPRARPARQAGDRARRRRQPADESRHAGDRGRSRAEEFLSISSARTAPTRRTAAIRSRTAARSASPAWRARAGYGSVHEFSDLKIFEQQIGAVLAETGPVFVVPEDRVERPAGARLQAPARPRRAPGHPRRAAGTLESLCALVLR